MSASPRMAFGGVAGPRGFGTAPLAIIARVRYLFSHVTHSNQNPGSPD